MSDKNIQRRSFFTSLFGAAAVTAVAVEAKPSPVAKGRVAVSSHGAWMCQCGGAMCQEHNNTMRCTIPECRFYNVPLRAPMIFTEPAESDEHEVIRHALIIVGVITPEMAPPPSDVKLCREVLNRLMRDYRDFHGVIVPAKYIRPMELAQELMPYYGFGTE